VDIDAVVPGILANGGTTGVKTDYRVICYFLGGAGGGVGTQIVVVVVVVVLCSKTGGSLIVVCVVVVWFAGLVPGGQSWLSAVTAPTSTTLKKMEERNAFMMSNNVFQLSNRRTAD
jgi:hypothetical protein